MNGTFLKGDKLKGGILTLQLK